MAFIGESFQGAPPPPTALERKVQTLLVQRSNLELALKGLLGAVHPHPSLHAGGTRDGCPLCEAVEVAERALKGVHDV